MIEYSEHKKHPFSITLKCDEQERNRLFYLGFEEISRLIFDCETGNFDSARWSVDSEITKFSFRDEEDAMMFMLKHF